MRLPRSISVLALLLFAGGVAVVTPVDEAGAWPICTGSLPANATGCGYDDMVFPTPPGPPNDTRSYTYVPNGCESTLGIPTCEFECNVGYTYNDATGTCDAGGGSATCSAIPRILSFVATPMSTTSGNSVTLSWSTQNATSVRMQTGAGAWGTVAANGSMVVTPLATTPYTLEARRGPLCPVPRETETVTVLAGPVPSCAVTATPDTLAAPGDVLVEWNSANTTECHAGWTVGTGPSGSQLVSGVSASTTYSMTCEDASGATAFCSTTVRLGDAPALPTFQRMGPLCIDTMPPALADDGRPDIELTVNAKSGTMRDDNAFIRAGGPATFVVRFRENAHCGDSTVRLRLTGDQIFELATTGVGVPTIVTPSPALVFSSVQRATTDANGVTSVEIVLRGAGTNVVRFDTITATVTDAAGNAAPATLTAPGTLTVDAVAPSCAIADPPALTLFNAVDFPLTLNVTAQDNADGTGKGAGIPDPVTGTSTSTFRYELDGTAVGTDQRTWTPASPSPSMQVSFTHMNDAAFGEYDEVSVDVLDAVGNVCTATTNYVVDNDSPVFVRALPISRGFITESIDTITLEFFDKDDAPGNNTNLLTLCNPAEPPTSGNNPRIALYDVTSSEYGKEPLVTEALSPACNGGQYPLVPLRGDGVNVPSYGDTNDTGEYHYVFLRTKEDTAPLPGRAPNVLTRGHRYELRIRDVQDSAGNIIKNNPIRVPFTFFGSAQPLRVSKKATSRLGTTYADPLQPGRGVEVERAPETLVDPETGLPVTVKPSTNCYKLFSGSAAALDPLALRTGGTSLDQSTYLVRNVLTMVAESAESLATGVQAPFTLSDQLPPYFQVVDLRTCSGAEGDQETSVYFVIRNSSGQSVHEGYATLAPTTTDTSATGFRNYGMNVDAPATDANYPDGQKGRQMIIPIGSCADATYGDLNQDQRVNGDDVQLLADYLASGSKPGDWTANLDRAQLDADGDVDADDAAVLDAYRSGLLACLPEDSQPPANLNVPAGGRIDVIYYTYVTGYADE